MTDREVITCSSAPPAIGPYSHVSFFLDYQGYSYFMKLLYRRFVLATPSMLVDALDLTLKQKLWCLEELVLKLEEC